VTGAEGARLKRVDLDTLIQRAWSEWANLNEGFGPPVERAICDALTMVGASVEEPAEKA
jgi:hypothetical protein